MKRAKRARRLSAVLAAATMALTVASVVAGPARAVGVTKVEQLRNAPIPASCDHPATTLDGFAKEFGVEDGTARLVRSKAVFGRLRGVRGSVAAVPMSCQTHGVAWPDYILLYAGRGRLIGTVGLAAAHRAQEYGDVVALHFDKGRIRVRWRAYDGDAYALTTRTGTIGWNRAEGHRTWSYTGPLTINFAHHRMTSGTGPGYVTGYRTARFSTYPAPKRFARFVQHRWNRLMKFHSCTNTEPEVVVDRFSHKGYAIGAELDCGGARAVWGRVHGRWRMLMSYQDGPYCDLTRRQRRALRALGQTCWDSSWHAHHLGRWPASGE